MSKFGEHLKSLIESSNTTIYALAKSSGLERTAIHKIISSGRIPDIKYVHQLANALQLTPEEQQHFFESYNISKVGEFKYNQRRQIKELIEKMADIEKMPVANAAHPITPLPAETNTVISGRFAVLNLIKNMIEFSISNESEPTIDFVIPESNQYFYTELLGAYLRCPQLKIRHVLGFTKQANQLATENKNLKLLSLIMPFAYVLGSYYQPYFYYQESQGVELTQAMPYFLITKNILILFDKDFENAIYICDDGVVTLYKNSFESMLANSKLFIQHNMSAQEAIAHVYDLDGMGHLETPSHWIGYDVGFRPCITDEIFEKYIKKDLPNREEFIKIGKAHWKFMRENQLRNINIASFDGIKLALDTGYYHTGISDIIEKVPLHFWKEQLELLKQKILKDEAAVFFVNPTKFNLPFQTFFAVNKTAGINLMIYGRNQTEFQVVCFHEESITNAFLDFVENIGELVYKKEESIIAIDDILKL